MREPQEVCAEPGTVALVTVAASDPILLAVPPCGLALAPDDRATQKVDGRFRMDRLIRF